MDLYYFYDIDCLRVPSGVLFSIYIRYLDVEFTLH